MATDIEESDTDEIERPTPAKKQKTLLTNNSSTSSLECEQENVSSNSLNISEEEEERRSREKLKGWQACQVAKGFVDNTINRVLENYIMSPPATYLFEDPWYRLFQGNRMEDTAVSMAIRNHGLVCSMEQPQSQTLSSNGNIIVPQNSCNIPLETQSTTSKEVLVSDEWMNDKYDSDQQKDFLDRAVAEAIKKKGLSTLSVDYG